MYWQVNEIHFGSICEEILGINIEADTKEEAIEIIEQYGYTVVGVNDILPTLKVVREEEK